MTLVLYTERILPDKTTEIIFAADVNYTVGNSVYSKQSKIKNTRRFLYSGTGPIGTDVIVEDLEAYAQENLKDDHIITLRDLYLFSETFYKLFAKYTEFGLSSGTIIIIDKFFPSTKFMIYLNSEKGFQIDFITDTIICEGSALVEGKAVLLTLLKSFPQEPLENIIKNTFSIVNEVCPYISKEFQAVTYTLEAPKEEVPFVEEETPVKPKRKKKSE
jgi:hypothetical protein